MNKKTFIVPVVLILSVFIISLVSAADWDNSIRYEDKDMTVVIRNFLGLGRELGRVKLTSHTEPTQIKNVIRGEDRAVMYYDFSDWEIYKNGLGEVRFIDMKTGKRIDKDYYFAKATYETIFVNDYEKVCTEELNYPNQTIQTICRNEVVGTHEEEKFMGWERLENNDIPSEAIRIALITDVNPEDYIDGVWTIAGKRLTRHAEWTEALNVDLWAYYNMNDNVDDATGNTSRDGNIIGSLTYKTGLIGNALYLGGTKRNNNFWATGPNWGADEWAVGIWVNFTTTDINEIVWSGGNGSAGGYTPVAGYIPGGGNPASFGIFMSVTGTSWSLNTGMCDTSPINQWDYYVITRNGNNVSGWKNGVCCYSSTQDVTLMASSIFILGAGIGQAQMTGEVDELGIWKGRGLSDAEITQLYNSGAGIAYDPSDPYNLEVTLNSPENNTYSSNSTLPFNASYDYTRLNITNATYYVYLDGGIFNKTTVTLTAAANSSVLNISSFTIGDYEWNVLGCGINTTDTICSWALTGNYTFEWRPFEIVSQTYDGTVYETEREKFELNITTIPSVLSVSSKLVYNGTSHSATTSCVAGACNIIKSIDIPLVTTGKSQNKTFFFNLTFYDGTSSYNFDTSSTTGSQNVSRIYLEVCNATYPTETMNFTVYDEKNLTNVRDFEFGSTFFTWLGQGTIKRNQSFDRSPINETAFCLFPNQTHYTDATIEYDTYKVNSTTYVKRNYYLQNYSITNVSKKILLYLLTAGDSTSFIQVVQDQKLSPVPGALILTQRFYPSDSSYRTVQISKTDDNGESIGFYEAETAEYKHVITLRGLTLLETALQKVVGKDVPYTLTFTVGDALTIPWSPWEQNPNILTSLSYNDTSKLVTFSYVDSTEETNYGNLLIFQEFSNNDTISIICNTSSTQSSATLTCNMTDYEGTFMAEGIIGTDRSIVDILQFAISTARDILGNTGLIVGFFIILTAGMAFIWNPVAGIVGINAAMWFVSMIGFITFPPVFLYAILGVSIITIILLKT